MLLSDMGRMLAGQTVYVQWAYRNIANDETVSITLKQGTSWQTLADSIPIVQGQTQWKLPETPGEDLLLRVSLKRDASVYDETEFEIYVISPGDINHDGRVNLEDVLLSLQVCAGTDESVVYTDTEINSDGKIGIQEVIYILQVVAGMRD